MALNGRFLKEEDDFKQFPEDVLPQLYEGYRTGTFVLEHDRSATLDSLSHTLHAPRKAPIRLKVSAVVMRELRCDMDQLCMVVDRCPNLASLYLERNEFRSEGMEELTKRLKGSTSLASLAIKRNYIGDKGAMVLASMLRASKKIVLKKLYLGYCNMGVDGARSILGAVQLLPLALTLTSLDLTANFLKEEGATAVANVLQTNKRIRFLNLSGNAIEDNGLKAIAESLNGSVLETLLVSQNHITEVGVRYLCDQLRKSPALTSLSLKSNVIEAAGGLYLAQGLRASSRLTLLDVSNNRLSDRGAESIAGSLRVTTCLKSLLLADNTINDMGAKMLASALGVNSSLTKLDLDVNPMTQVGKEQLLAALKLRPDNCILHVGSHAYGALLRQRAEQELVAEAKRKAEEQVKAKAAEEAAKLAEQRAEAAAKAKKEGKVDLSNVRAQIDTGNVVLKIEKKVEAPKPEGAVGELFKTWSVAGAGQKGSKLAKSMDYKEYLEMLGAIGIVPGKMSKAAAQEVFKQANRAGPVADGDNKELDWMEFKFAIQKIGERIRESPDEIASRPVVQKNAGGRKGSLVSKESLLEGADIETIFAHFAASGGQSKKRARSLDAGEFRQMLEFINVMPDRASKTMVMEVFSKAKKHSSDSSELDWPACQWAMQQLAKKMNLPYETLHQLKK